MQPSPKNASALMEVRALRKSFVQRRGLVGRRFTIDALRGVSLEIQRGATLAIVGESGSGKSTLANCLAGIEPCDSGEIWFDGRDLSAVPSKRRMAEFRQVQMVFQDAASSLNPIFTAEEIVAEPLAIARTGSREERRQRAHELMEEVGLRAQWAGRRPMEFSGGQRQRLAIARSLAVQPKLIIFDEALTGLDLLTRAQIVQLLKELQAQHGLTYLHITHDLDLTQQWADEIAVMCRGEIIERTLAARRMPKPEAEQAPQPVAAGVEA